MTKMGFLEKAGDRWWPVLGSVFMVSAIKRVSTLTLVGRVEVSAPKKAPQLSTATNLSSHPANSQLEKTE